MKFPSKDGAKRSLMSSLIEGLLRTNGTGVGAAVDESAAETQSKITGLVYGRCEVCRSASVVAFALDRHGSEVGICADERCYRAATSR